MISFHAASAFLSGILSLLCAVKTWRNFKKTKNNLVLFLALDFFSMAAAMFFLVPPSFLFDSSILPLFLSLAVFFLFLGISFFLQIPMSNIRRKIFKRDVFITTAAAGAAIAIITFFAGPSLTFSDNGLKTIYHFPEILKIFLGVFIILMTSLLSGFIFFSRGFSSSARSVQVRSILFGLALLCVGIGVFLVVMEESFFYNLFIVLAFVLFYSSIFFVKMDEAESPSGDFLRKYVSGHLT